MIPKRTISIIANTIADNKFKLQCELLDTKINQSLREAFKSERIGQERLNRIVNKFCNNLLGGKL